ncbi:Transcription initiation factor TFIID subunit 2 [Puccinia graminis f. sp. tritici]|uniref:Transcription initiation factor TFIID subunit 2 n=1 Tax=Puccinia graminis f. sp. tritici TaxID=56615 RepID=A0A5B0N5F6_PUCGR|nr:Transcription initiation factor TFIID subunit 2 [Puccinia graminis f. sp. tritici]KAA1132218.1 Transcription initiation factor TFIID subunit 2 [Puccinia graminis f. sp. tritici]
MIRQTSWAEKCNLKPVDRFEGEMPIRIKGSDGIPYEHVPDIKEPFKRYGLPSNHKNKKIERPSRPYASSNQAPDPTETFTYSPWECSQEERDRWKIDDRTEEEDQFITQSKVERFRLDVEVEWIFEFSIEMKEFMWLEELQRDHDVVAQVEAVRALKTIPSKVVSSHLCRVAPVLEYIFQMRNEAVLALDSCATCRCGVLGLFHLLKLFQSRYCYPPRVEPDSPWHIRPIPKPNQFHSARSEQQLSAISSFLISWSILGQHMREKSTTRDQRPRKMLHG